MSKITQKQLIEELKALKDIKPRHEWVVLTKSQIFEGHQEVAKIPAQKIANWEIEKFIRNWKLIIENSFFGFSIQKRLAYSFATVAFIFVGLIGFAQYTMPGDLLFPVRKITEKSEAVLIGQTELKQNAATLNSRINDLAKATKQGKKDNIPAAISEINIKASELAKDIKQFPAGDPETLKEIAVSLKVLADVTGTDENLESAQVQDLYHALVENQIADLKTATLTEEQAIVLTEIEEMQNQADYVGALEKILEITN